MTGETAENKPLALPRLGLERCVLRPLEAGDARALARHADDEAVWRNLFEGFPRPYTLADAQAWCAGGWRGAGWVWGIEVAAAGGTEVAGCIGLRPDAGWLRCNAELGYWLGRSHWRRGIVGEAARAVLGWAWAERTELTRIYAPIFAWNEGSMGVARAAGMALEARLPQSAVKAGRVIDRVQFAAYRASAIIEEPT